jgi:RNA polymerase sigma factor FliA
MVRQTRAATSRPTPLYRKPADMMPSAPTGGDLNREVRRYEPLVRRMASRMAARLPANVELDDLVQVGMIGLAEVLQRFDASQSVPFEAYAGPRIRGAMLDELRSSDVMSRGNRQQQRRIASTVTRLEHRLGRAPQASEVAAELGLALDEFQELQFDARGTQTLYLEDLSGDEDGNDYLDRHVADDNADPLNMLTERRRHTALVAAIKALPEREQRAMSLFYEHDMSLKQIAALFGVTESRVCQLHRSATARLGIKLAQF